MDAPADLVEELQVVVWRNRYLEARQAGLEHMDAIRFARSGRDVAELRALVRGECPPELIARIIL